MLELISFLASMVKYAPAFAALAKAIAMCIDEEEKKKFAGEFTKGWQSAIETGDTSHLHALIDAHPHFKLRE